SAQSTEAAVNMTVQPRKRRLRPSAPASQPVAGSTTALAARYQVSTQDTPSTPAESEPWMCGSATLVTVTSSTCITVTTITDAGMAHFRADPTGTSPARAAVSGPAALTPARECAARDPGRSGRGARDRPAHS